MSKRRAITAKYQWLMVADPLLCGSGATIARLQRCNRLNRGEPCVCRFLINDLADDMVDIGAEEFVGWFESDIEAEDMPELVREFASHVARARLQKVSDDSIGRAQAWLARFRSLAAEESGLTGRYTDVLDD